MTGVCNKSHVAPHPEMGKSRQVSDGELDQIVDRLYKSQTKSFAGTAGEQAKAVDIISRKNGDVDTIVERLYKTDTKGHLLAEEEQKPVAVDQISRKVVDADGVNDIVERLHTTHTLSSGCLGKPPVMCNNSVARTGLDEGEMQEIYKRLATTQTKSGSGEVCRTMDPPKPPGYGLAMWPAIEGLDERFMGAIDPAKKDESLARLVKTQTTSSQARLDNPRILLYPERTTLMNNVDRIKAYQDSGATTRQKDMQRREKWFN